MNFEVGDGPKGPGVARPNFCGGAILYDYVGKRSRLNCRDDALHWQALCSSCTARERDEVSKDIARVQLMSGKSDRSPRRGGGY